VLSLSLFLNPVFFFSSIHTALSPIPHDPDGKCWSERAPRVKLLGFTPRTPSQYYPPSVPPSKIPIYTCSPFSFFQHTNLPGVFPFNILHNFFPSPPPTKAFSLSLQFYTRIPLLYPPNFPPPPNTPTSCNFWVFPLPE